MKGILKTTREWREQGLAPMAGEDSLHLNKYGEALWRRDQVDAIYEDEELVTEYDDEMMEPDYDDF